MKAARRRLAEPVRVHRWVCGCTRRVRALYYPKNVVHEGVCSAHVRRAERWQTRILRLYDQLVGSINQTTHDAVLAGNRRMVR